MAKVTLNDLSKALGLNEKEPKKDFHYYGTIVSSNPEDRTYEVSINRDQNISVEAARLVGAAVGDTVMVTVMANGYATVTGRLGGDLDATDAQRAADDAADAASGAMSTAQTAMTNASEANRIANNAKTLAENAEAEAGRAKTAADNAVAEAARSASAAEESERQAKRSADAADASEASATQSARAAASSQASASQSAQSAADSQASAARSEQSAQESATSAANSAASASRSTIYANAALNQLGIVEDVAGTLDWIAKHGTYTKTTDTAIDSSKVYFVYDSSTGDYTPVIDPKTSELNTYYELDITESQADFIMSHLAVTSRGLWVLPNGIGSASDPKDAPKYKALLAADGMWIYDDHGVMVAKYGDGISFDSTREYRIGDQNTYIRYIDSNNDGIADRIEIKAASISLGSSDLATKISDIEDQISSTDEDLANYITSQEDVIEDLQNQIDGAIDTWYYSGDPTLSNQPAVAWTTDETKENHLRDLYFNTQNGHSFRFAKEGNTYKWIQIEDADAIKALADAAAAQGTANVKKRVFVAQPTPPYDIGDLWVQGSAGDIKRCSTAKTSAQSFAAADWVLASKYTDDTKANAVDGALTNFKSEFTVTPAEISSEVKATKNGETLVTRINQTADTVKIEAEHVEIDGTATFNAIKSQADAAYDAKGAADAVQVGGRNLLKNTASPSTSIWSKWGSGTLERTSNGIRLTSASDSQMISFKIPLVYDNAAVGDEDYVISFDYKSNVTTNGGYFICTSGNNHVVSLDKAIVASETEWAHYESTFKTNSTTGQTVNSILIPYSSKSGWLEIKDGSIKLEKGNKATDWTPAPEDVQSEIDSKKSIHTLDSSYSKTYAQLLTWSKEGYDAGQWAVSSTAGVAVGDTVRIKCSVSDMNNAAVYVLGTVTDVTSATILRMKSHGLDTTVIDGGNILANSITANQLNVTNINASKSLTVGAMTTDAQNSILNSKIEVGGRNLLRNSANPSATFPAMCTLETEDGENYIKFNQTTKNWSNFRFIPCIPISFVKDKTITVSFEARAYNLPSASTASWLYVNPQTYETNADTDAQRIRYRNMTYSSDAFTEGKWVKFSYTIPVDLSTWLVTSGKESTESNYITLCVFNYSGNRIDLRRVKLELGNKATDWTPAPEDVASDIDDASKVAKNYLSFTEEGGLNIGYTGKIEHTNIKADGMRIYDKDETNPGIPAASFLSNGSTIGKAVDGESRTVTSNKGMRFYKRSGSEDITLAHIGYDQGVDKDGNTNTYAPYYTFGKRKDGSAIGNYSHAEGNNPTAGGYCSHAEGWGTTASAAYSHAEGRATTASEEYSHAEGNITTASGYGSHAEGDFTTASGSDSHAEGSSTTASGNDSHAEGHITTASGEYSHTGGYYTVAGYSAQTVIGKYNSNKSNTAFEIGNGYEDHRSNALTVDWSGNIVAAGGLTLNGNKPLIRISEEGTTGHWRYRKWSDGRYEAWYNSESTTITTTTSSGNGWYRNSSAYTIAVPSFVSTIHYVTVQAMTDYANVITSLTGASKANGIKYYVSHLGSLSSVSAYITAYITGGLS